MADANDPKPFDARAYLYGKIVDELRAPRCPKHANPLLSRNLRLARACPDCHLLRGDLSTR